MKICLAACLSVVLGGTLTAVGQVPAAPHPHSLSLHVEPVSSGGTSDINDSAHTHNASYSLNDPSKKVHETKSKSTEVNEREENLQIDVRNFGQLPDTAQVEYFFMARLVSGNRNDYILDQGSKPVTVPPGGSISIPAESKKVTETITRKTSSHFHKEETKADHGSDRDKGSVMTGWMVRVVADGKVIDARGSRDDLEAQAKDLGKLPIIK